MPDTKGWGGPRRYKPGADGELHRTWNGKLPEEFTPADTFSFMADTDIQLHGKVSADTLAAIHAAGYDYQGGAVVPMPGKENRNMSKDVILTPEQIAAEEKRWLFEVPIAELAEVKGVSIDGRYRCGLTQTCRTPPRNWKYRPVPSRRWGTSWALPA